MNSRRAIAVVASIAIVLAVPGFAYAQGDEETPQTVEYIVTVDTANLREGPGTSFPVVGTVAKGDSLLIYDEPLEVDGWLHIYQPDSDSEAYIADFLVERAPVRFYPPEQEPVFEVTGRGRSTSDVYDIPQGAYRIDATVGDNSFILKSIVIAGDCRDSNIFNELSFDANQLTVSGLFVSRGCSIVFETDNVSGNWSFAVRDLLDPESIASSLLPLEDGGEISGTGRALTMATLLPNGAWRISADVADNAFILRSNVLDGDCNDTSVFNELDFDANSLEASTVYRSEGGELGGCIIFWETNNVDGDWTLTFEQF